MSSANGFSLDQPELLSFGKELNRLPLNRENCMLKGQPRFFYIQQHLNVTTSDCLNHRVKPIRRCVTFKFTKC